MKGKKQVAFERECDLAHSIKLSSSNKLQLSKNKKKIFLANYERRRSILGKQIDIKDKLNPIEKIVYDVVTKDYQFKYVNIERRKNTLERVILT